MYPKETTSTGWFDAFVSWLRHARMGQAGGVTGRERRTSSHTENVRQWVIGWTRPNGIDAPKWFNATGLRMSGR